MGQYFQENDLAQFFEPKPIDAHKGDRGYVAIVAGSERYSGAAKLSNLAACACGVGAGVVKLAVPESIKNAVIPQLLDSTLFPLNCGNDGGFIFNATQALDLISKCKCVACGMGMGHSKQLIKLVGFLLENFESILVLDADATWAYTQLKKSYEHQGLLDPRKRKCQLVMTPHLGEFSTLSGEDVEAIKQNSDELIRNFAAQNHCVLLLKGAETKVCAGGEIYISETNCPGMAKAGSGDVLSGILCAVLASNYDKLRGDKDLLARCVCACAFINGKAGELNCQANNEFTTLSSETPIYLRQYLNESLS